MSGRKVGRVPLRRNAAYPSIDIESSSYRPEDRNLHIRYIRPEIPRARDVRKSLSMYKFMEAHVSFRRPAQRGSIDAITSRPKMDLRLSKRRRRNDGEVEAEIPSATGGRTAPKKRSASILLADASGSA